MQTDATWPTTPNIVGRYILRPFVHPVACCCVLLGVVKFEADQTFSYVQTDATTPNNDGSCLANKVASAYEVYVGAVIQCNK